MDASDNIHLERDENRLTKLIPSLGKGKADVEFSRHMTQVIDRVIKTGKSGKVVLTVEITKPDKASEDQIGIDYEVSSKPPRLHGPRIYAHVDENIAAHLQTEIFSTLPVASDEAFRIADPPDVDAPIAGEAPVAPLRDDGRDQDLFA